MTTGERERESERERERDAAAAVAGAGDDTDDELAVRSSHKKATQPLLIRPNEMSGFSRPALKGNAAENRPNR